MWDLQIGEKYNLCSATKVFNIKNDELGNVSENSKEYWVGETPNLKLSGRIDKSHKVGVKVSSMIESDENADKIYDYIERELFKKVSVSEMVSIVKNMQSEYYRKGRESKVNEFHDLFKV